MNRVPVHEALFWPGRAPVSDAGAVDWRRLAWGLAQARYRGAASGPGAARKPGGAIYSRAQHAVELSHAVDALAGLGRRRRRVIDTHVWLAGLREAALADEPGPAAADARTRLALRVVDVGAWAAVLAPAMRGDEDRGTGPVPGAAQGRLRRLAELDPAERRGLALHALFSELLPAGLGVAAADTVLRAAGLDGEIPGAWVEILRFVRRMGLETVRRDVPGASDGERTGFPALDARIAPRRPEAAGKLWLERFRALNGPDKKTWRGER